MTDNNNCFVHDECALVYVWVRIFEYYVIFAVNGFWIRMEIPRAPNHALFPYGIQSLLVILYKVLRYNQRHQKFKQK